MRFPSTLYKLIQRQSELRPAKPAILGTEGSPLTYQHLLAQIDDTVSSLNAVGIGRNDPVAIVLPNGPMMATAFLSVASIATSAPLNPAFTRAEFDFYLRDLGAKAVLVQEHSDSPVLDVARELGIPTITLIPQGNAPAGMFTCKTAEQPGQAVHAGLAKMSDVALILHTSGTTMRPKMVPLTHKNLTTSAENIRETLGLTPDDRCLNVMPLFHIHGLVAAVLASLTAGASIVCTPGFYAPQFFPWLDAFKPSWYTAVPTMHQAILNRAREHSDRIQKARLRFIRSSSASLAPSVMASIEKTFSVPVIEAYGMTEAAHQMACNPLPPGVRKPGSVGLPAGPQIAIMAEDRAERLPQNTPGEIVIRGDNVTLGYLNNPDANEKSFIQGWFRTGDQGYLDSEGYLFITGRLKEIINRGGEKISPREVDEVLLQHLSLRAGRKSSRLLRMGS
jgi:acyl-CoA synthetase (AMP-forming)/AMP-acid ligase II